MKVILISEKYLIKNMRKKKLSFYFQLNDNEKKKKISNLSFESMKTHQNILR